ncbi:MAG: 2'-5' RNA ligase family protein [Nanoarchaeota archaeon]
MDFKHPHRYGFMILTQKSDYTFLERYKKKRDPLVQFYMKPEFFNNIAPQHLSLCYFSYPDKYPSTYIKRLIPKLIPIIKKHMPIQVRAQGFQGGWEIGLSNPAILWNITDYKKTNQFHNEIIQALQKDIQHFNDPETDYTPHIGIALGKQECLQELKKFITTTKKTLQLL